MHNNKKCLKICQLHVANMYNLWLSRVLGTYIMKNVIACDNCSHRSWGFNRLKKKIKKRFIKQLFNYGKDSWKQTCSVIFVNLYVDLMQNWSYFKDLRYRLTEVDKFIYSIDTYISFQNNPPALSFSRDSFEMCSSSLGFQTSTFPRRYRYNSRSLTLWN